MEELLQTNKYLSEQNELLSKQNELMCEADEIQEKHINQLSEKVSYLFEFSKCSILELSNKYETEIKRLKNHISTLKYDKKKLKEECNENKKHFEYIKNELR